MYSLLILPFWIYAVWGENSSVSITKNLNFTNLFIDINKIHFYDDSMAKIYLGTLNSH